MTARPARLIREVLLSEGICQPVPSLPWRCVTTKMPDGIGTVDSLVAVIEHDDVQEGRYISNSNYLVDPHVQIITRSVGLNRSYEKLREIALFLDTIRDYSVAVDGDEYRIYDTKRTTNIQARGLDATGRRYVYAIEYDIMLH